MSIILIFGSYICMDFVMEWALMSIIFFLLLVCISLAVDACQVNNFLWLSTAAKESYILGCWWRYILGCQWPPRKVISLAAVKFYWLICNFGASLLYLAAKPPKNNPCRLAAKKIGFPWLSILGGFYLAASRQGSFPWRFWCFPWRFLAAKVIPFWCSALLL